MINERSNTGSSEKLAQTRTLGHGKQFVHTMPILWGYWAFCTVFALLTLRDEIFSWRVANSWQNYLVWALVALVITIAAQVGYVMVARHDGRPLAPVSTLIFVIVNGLLEAFVFMGIYRVFFTASKAVFGDMDAINLLFGFLGFFLYSGLIHAMFWARLIPPHFTAEPSLQRLRRMLTPIQTVIVISWCVYYYYTGDIWTIVAFHLIIDTVLMIRVRPPILFATTKAQA